MTAANEQIVASFEELGMTPEEIAADQDLDVLAVKSILMQCSPAYRKSCKTVDENNFTDEEAILARQIIVNLARYSEDERLQARCAMYIRDDVKGRLDAPKQLAGLNVNVLMWNEQMKKALAAVQRSKAITIDTETKTKLLENANVSS